MPTAAPDPRPVIGAMGELLVEFVCSEKDGRNLRPAPYIGPFPSGAPGIFIDQAARAGARAVFAGAVGADAFGEVILARLAEAGVAPDLLRRLPGETTGSAHVSYNSDGSRDFVFNMARSAAGRFPHGQEALDGFRRAGTEVLHISGSALGDPAMRAHLFEVAMALADEGVDLSIDPNIRIELMADAGYLDTLRALVGRAAYVLPSDADADLLWPGRGFADWSGEVLAQGARVVALKRGAAGAVARGQDQTVDMPGHAVTVVDPTGAGDCFCGTFVTRLAAGDGLALALSRANAAGALAVTRLGPMEGNSTLAAIDAFGGGQG